ncbi:MAG: SMP-30/gluconolactonase/LRE family protein [Faecalibacterium sp.]
MALGMLEIGLLVCIVAILFGPAVIKKFKKYQNMYLKRNKRLQKVVAQRRAERLAQEKIRNAKIKMVVFSVLGAILLSSVLYLAVWPLPMQVNAYAQGTQGAVDAEVYSVASVSSTDQTLSIEGYQNITQIRYYNDWIYAAAEGGKIIRIRENGTGLTELVSTGGEIMSFDFDAENNIIFTDALYDDTGGALLMASFDGFAVTVEPLLSYSAGDGLSYPTGVAVAADGMIYILNATDISAVECGGTLAALRTAQTAHSQDGVLYAYDPTTGSCEVMVSGLCFGAGLALCAQEDVLYISQFTDSSVWSVSVDTRAQTLGAVGTVLICEGLAGYPAGLSVAEDGTLWVALSATQMSWFESLSALPAWREVLLRLPQGTRDALLQYNGKGLAVALDAEGNFVASYAGDGSKGLNMLTSVSQIGDCLYFAQANKNETIGFFVLE